MGRHTYHEIPCVDETYEYIGTEQYTKTGWFSLFLRAEILSMICNRSHAALQDAGEGLGLILQPSPTAWPLGSQLVPTVATDSVKQEGAACVFSKRHGHLDAHCECGLVSSGVVTNPHLPRILWLLIHWQGAIAGLIKMSASSIKMSAKSQDGGEIEQSIRSTEDDPRASEREKRLRRKIDLRLCTIGALLASMNLIDSGVISSASVTSMLPDLGLDRGNRLSVAILILTVSSVLFQLPATIIVRLLGPRVFFTCTTICFGVFTLVRSKTKMYGFECSPRSRAQHSSTPGSKWLSCESYSGSSWYCSLLYGQEPRWRTNQTVWNIARNCFAGFQLVQARFDSPIDDFPRYH